MPRAFLVRTKPAVISSDVSPQGVETGKEQGKYSTEQVVIFQGSASCNDLHTSQLTSPGTCLKLRIIDLIFPNASEQIWRSTVINTPICQREKRILNHVYLIMIRS